MEISALLKDDRQITVLAGAGLSAPPPTCLPGWWALNDAVLGALGAAIEQIANSPGLSDGFRDAIRQRRDSTPFLMPDLQAQLLEDELGPAYFRSLSALDSEEPNAAHHLLAELARQGRVAAVLTTNFDCTIERAFDAAAVVYRRYVSPEDFERLDEAVMPVPVVKIHGSADRPDTMVDTLRQRLQGRPASLEQWMQRRFIHFPTVGMGFSCEDLQYDPDYLGIRPAVHDGARFCFLVRYGATPSVPLQRLVADFPHQVSTSEGELPDWLFEVARTLGVAHDVPRPAGFTDEDIARRRARAARRLDESLGAWAASLGPMATLNAVTSLLTAAARRRDADYLLRRMWESYRAPDDCMGPSYARYLQNYGEVLLRQGRLHNPHDRESDFAAWKNAADRDPRQFSARAVAYGGAEDCRARSLLCEFLAGLDVPRLAGPAADLLESISKARGDDGSLPGTVIDASFSLAEVLELTGLGQAAPPLLEDAHRSAVALGDEFRRAEAAWRLARNLAFGLDRDASAQARVAELAAECCDIAARLNIREADAGAALARAIAAIARSDWAAAVEQVHNAETIYREIDDLPGEIFAKRERVRALVGAATEAGQMDGAQFDELNEALQRFAIENAPGLRPLIKFELAQLASYFDDQFARDLATDAAQDAQLQGHPVLVTEARELRNSLSTS
jgi:hypothetical protein